MARARARDALRRSVGALTVTALLGAAVAVGAELTWPSSAALSARPPAGAVPSSAPSQSTLVHPTPSPARTILPTPRTSPTPTARPSEAVGAPGIAIASRPESDGSFLVSEVITLPAPATEAVLRPPSIGNAGTRFKQLRPAATQVEVSAGGQALPVPDGPVRSEVTLRWNSPTQQLRLRYRLTQVSVASRPAKTGRTGRPRLTDRPDACRLAGQGGRDGPDRAVSHLSAASAGETVLWCRHRSEVLDSTPDSVRPVASAGAVRPAGAAMRS